jgi:hypothetical protein
MTGSNLWFLTWQLLVRYFPDSSPRCSKPKTQYLILFLSLLALKRRDMLYGGICFCLETDAICVVLLCT